MLNSAKKKLQRKINSFRCRLIRKDQKLPDGSFKKGYLTIYHDYEGKYALPHVEDMSIKGVNYILDAEKEFNVKATFNIVGKLIIDYPKIVDRIIFEGHEMASHSYDHKIMSDLSFEEVCFDISETKKIFESTGIKLCGFRSPQGRWSFKQMRALLSENLLWSAENDNANSPYVLLQEKEKKLIRLPIKMDDWEYISQKSHPNTMLKKLIETVDRIANERTYGAIGFHPWIQGADEHRLLIFREFLEDVSYRKDIEIVTFGKMYDRYAKVKEIST